MELPIKTSDLSLNTEIIRQAHRLMMEHRDRKDVLAGEYIRLYLQAIIFLHQLAILKDIWKAQFLGFIKLKRMI